MIQVRVCTDAFSLPDWIARPREKVEDAGRFVCRARPARLALLPLAERDRISRVSRSNNPASAAAKSASLFMIVSSAFDYPKHGRAQSGDL
jgi:hypothetical protein